MSELQSFSTTENPLDHSPALTPLSVTPAAVLAPVGVKAGESTFYIRNTPTSPAVKVWDYRLLKEESRKVDVLIDEVMTASHAKTLPNLLAAFFRHVDVDPVIARSLRLDPAALDVMTKRLLYLFAVGRTGLLGTTRNHLLWGDDDGLLLRMKAELMIDELPLHIKALRADPTDEAALGEIAFLLAVTDLDELT